MKSTKTLIVTMLMGVGMSASYAAEATNSDVEVFVIVGENAIPLGVDHRFPDASVTLPGPGTSPLTDPHDRQHNAKRYCYRFVARGNYEILELFDSDFGMHTAQISRVPASAGKECTLILSQPKFTVNGAPFSLSAKELPKLSGFLAEKKGLIRLSREWSYLGNSGICFSRSVSVEASTDENGISSITVMNWSEPGC